MCSILRPKLQKTILNKLGLIIVLHYHVISIYKMSTLQTTSFNFAQNFGILENHVNYEGAFLVISKSG